ncbi:MAG: hypothetical protein AAF488_03325 [Planctomycetota bacterium]
MLSRMLLTLLLVEVFLVPTTLASGQGGGPSPSCPLDVSAISDPTGTNAANFGGAVAADEDLLVVGAYFDGGVTLGYPGSVSIYRWNGVEHVLEQKIVGPLPADAPRFGSSVAVDGSVVVVGAPGVGFDSVELVYVYRLQDGVWVEEQVLSPSDGAPNVDYGDAVSIDGDTIAVGAPGDDEAAGQAGAVYLYRWDGSTWNEETKLFASDATSDDTLGNSVSLDGDTLIAGAAGAIFVGQFNAGAAYCFRYDGAAWIETGKLTASPPVSYDQFGMGVAVGDGTVAITSGYGGAGQAYIFAYDGETWELQQQLLPGSDETPFGGLGWMTSVAIDGDTVAFGDDEGPLSGGLPHNVYVYRFDGIEWTPQATLSSAGAPADERYGSSLALAEDRLAIGIPGRDGVGSDIGAVEVVELCRSGFARGDINQDALINIADVIYGLDFLFEPGAAAPPCPDAADVNDDGALDLADPIALLGLLFESTVNAIPYPYPLCGADPTPDTIPAGLCSEVCP